MIVEWDVPNDIPRRPLTIQEELRYSVWLIPSRWRRSGIPVDPEEARREYYEEHPTLRPKPKEIEW